MKQEFYFRIARDKFEEQYRRGRGLDARAIAVTGMATTIAGIAAIVLKDFSGAAGSISFPAAAVTAALGVTVLAVLWCSLQALKPRSWRHDPDLSAFGLSPRGRGNPFWAIANPRNGWGCKCFTRFVTRAQYRRYLAGGVAAPVSGDGTPDRMRPKTKLVDRPAGAPLADDEAPALKRMTYVNSRTDETHTGYVGDG